MRLTLALTGDPLPGSGHPLWDRIGPSSLGRSPILSVLGSGWEGMAGIAVSPGDTTLPVEQ